MLDKNYYEELVEQTLNELESKLGLDISSTSNTRQIVEKIRTFEAEMLESLSENISKLSVTNLIDSDLDRIYGEFFGIPRISMTTADHKKVLIQNDYGKDLYLEKDTQIVVNNFNYAVLEGTTILKNSQSVVEVFPDSTIYQRTNLQPISDVVLLEFKDYNLEFVGKIYALKIEETNLESDTIYKERSKPLIQNQGFSNITKIKNRCRTISELHSIQEIDKKYETELVIIPTDIKYIDELKKYVEEVVSYYKGSNITVSKPSLTFITVLGLEEQIKKQLYGTKYISELDNHLQQIYLEAEKYIKAILLDEAEEKQYSPKKMEILFNKYVIENNLPIVIDETKLQHIFGSYNREDYTNAMAGAIIPRLELKKIDSDIIALKAIK